MFVDDNKMKKIDLFQAFFLKFPVDHTHFTRFKFLRNIDITEVLQEHSKHLLV